jgi:hypothetical protein
MSDDTKPIRTPEQETLSKEMLAMIMAMKKNPNMYTGKTTAPKSPFQLAQEAQMMQKAKNGPGDQFARQKALANKYTGFGAKSMNGNTERHSRNLDTQLKYEQGEADKRKQLNPFFFDENQSYMKDWDKFNRTGGLPEEGDKAPVGGDNGSPTSPAKPGEAVKGRKFRPPTAGRRFNPLNPNSRGFDTGGPAAPPVGEGEDGDDGRGGRPIDR